MQLTPKDILCLYLYSEKHILLQSPFTDTVRSRGASPAVSSRRAAVPLQVSYSGLRANW